MKLAITGKGGVGKTTIASLLIQIYASEGNTVLAIDANPDANLAIALGMGIDEATKIVSISEMAGLIEERTGVKPGTSGSLFKLNPKVDDIPERFSIKKDNIMLLVMGTVKKGEGGCLCPESSLLKNLVSHLVFRSNDVLIMDMDAGVEHLGRGTAKAVDAFIIIVEPGQRSFQTARSIQKLAQDMGIKKHYIIGSKTCSNTDRQFIRENLPGFDILGFVDYNPDVVEADKQGISVFMAAPAVVKQVKEIMSNLEKLKLNKGG